MKNFSLTDEEVQELRVAHKSAKNKADAYRINAVILLGTDWSLVEVVDALLIDDETLRNYVKNYKDGGLEQLHIIFLVQCWNMSKILEYS
jgi:hypothetical protein